MGLGEQQSAGAGSTFSEDVLKLDISGPKEEHFSVVDVPGIFKKTTEGVTTKADMAMVREMVRAYMVNPRSVILAVTPANVDIATQEILEMANEADPDGERTLGVLTKPDLVDEGAEGAIVDLLVGKWHTLKLGWCMVKNLGQKDLEKGGADRNGLERAYFNSTSPWKDLDHDRLGVDALKVRLKEILADTIRRTFQTVKQEILRRLLKAKKELSEIGAERQSAEQQRDYLMAASMQFERLVRDALSGKYGRDDWFDKHQNHKLATAIVTRNEAFSKSIEHYGHSYAWADEERRIEVCEPVHAPPSIGSSELEEKQAPSISVRMEREDPELQEVVFSETEVDATVGEGITGWLTEVYTSSRGFELGTFEGHILATTMKAQSERWEALGLGYISDIITLTHDFVKGLLELVLPDSRVRAGILSNLIEGLLASYHTAYERAKFLLTIERSGTPITINHYFNDTLQKLRQERVKKLMAANAFSVQRSSYDSSTTMVVPLDDLTRSHPMANREHTVSEIKDILESYYKVARKRFVDNMCMQAADYFLVNGPESPLLHFSPTFVNKLSEEQLDEIAGEDGAVKRRRRALQKLVGELEAGRKIVM